MCSVSPGPMTKMGSDSEEQAMVSALPEQVQGRARMEAGE